MVNWISKLFGRDDDHAFDAPVVSVDDMQYSAGAVTPPAPEYGWWAGDKYHGGFGPTQIFEMDYWELRQRSSQLYRENIYARGIIRRIITNEINTGLTLEAIPDGDILGIDDETLADWSENVENRFAIWARNPKLCDVEERRTYGQLQREIRQEALVAGDILVMLDISRVTGLPKIRTVNGANVQNPADESVVPDSNTVEHGVERNKDGKHVAFHVVQEDGTTKRVPAFGPRSGRRVAWLVYGSDKRMDDVRGEPLLSIILQSLKEVDRYRDAAQRKAAINAIWAAAVEKSADKMGTKPISGGAVRKTSVSVDDDTNSARSFKITQHLPGMIIEELQQGEKLVPHSTAGTDVNFGPFEEVMIAAIAWLMEIPPEILRLTFSNNYSASQAAINEYKMNLNVKRIGVGEQLCHPVYLEWLVSEVLQNKIQAAGFLESWRNPRMYDTFGAWIASDWTGAIKPATDLVKQAKGYQMLESECWITNERAARELTGTKFRKNAKRIKRENELKVEAARVIMEFENEVGDPERAAALLHGGMLGITAEDAMIEDESEA